MSVKMKITKACTFGHVGKVVELPEGVARALLLKSEAVVYAEPKELEPEPKPESESEPEPEPKAEKKSKKHRKPKAGAVKNIEVKE